MLNFDLYSQTYARQINVLLRLSEYLSTEAKILIYKSLIRSNFNVWHLCSKTSSAKMEKMQYGALRLLLFFFFFNDFDSSYKKVNVPTLHVSRVR